ncbi:MAG: MCE family protein [Betaproteobacteria bacterium]|nr:MCE family protein [Betaproteobacteria bacterium]
MENRAYALAAGLFTMLLGAALVAVAFWFGKDDLRLVPYVVATDTSVAGLKVEAAVRYRGVEVGKVESIRIDSGSNGRIHIRLGVNEGTPITGSTFARLGYQGVTGLAYVALDDSGASREPLASSAWNVAEIPLQRSIFDSGEDLIGALGGVAERLNALLDEDNQQALKRSLAGLEKATLRVAALAEKMEPGAAAVPALIGDARGALADARGALGDARAATANASRLVNNLSGLALKIDERVDALSRAARSVEEVGVTARSVNDETLPRVNALVEELRRETLAVDRLINALGEHPQSIVFGTPPGRPGPGEPGFHAGGER